MTDREELGTILRLIKKHGLPLSPILEYAINERLEQIDNSYDCEELSESIVSDCDAPKMEHKTQLCEYETKFANLSVSMAGDRKAPNKAVLLLAIMKLIEDGQIVKNEILPDQKITVAFAEQWIVQMGRYKVPSLWKPYYHLKSDMFWHFKPSGNENQLMELFSYGGTASIGKLRSLIKYAYLDAELFDYMRDENSRNRLREVLINTYIKNQ